MKIKSLIAAVLAVITLLSSLPVAYAAQVTANLNEVVTFSTSQHAFITADVDGGKVMTVSYDYTADNGKYTVSVFDAATASVTASKSFKYKHLPLESIDECEIMDDGSYAVYDRYNGKSALYDSELSYQGTGKCEKYSYNNDALWTDHKLVTDSFIKEREYAFNYYRSDFSPTINVMAFLNEPTTLSFTEAPVSSIYAHSGKRFLISEADEKSTAVTASVYDFSKKTFVSVTTRAFKGYHFNNIVTGAMDESYAFFVVENDKENEGFYTPFIWKYSAETVETPFQLEKVNSKQLKNKNNAFITEMKNTYGINILVNKLPNTYPTYWDEEKGEEYGGVIKGAQPFDEFRVLNDLSGYLKYFPKDFTREMAYFDGVKHEFDIYIDKEIIGDSAAFANRYDGFLICFATDEFSSSYIPHEFLHLIDARIDAYLKSVNKDYEEEWDKLNPKNFFYYAEQDFNEKYFASSYAMTDPREDRADTFEYLFEAYNMPDHPYANNPVKKKAIYLSNLIRVAYPSVQKLTFASWEKWITPYPEKFKAKTTTNSLKVYWSECRTATQYQLQQKKKGVWKTVYSGAKRKYSFTGLNSGKAFSFRVRALRYDGKRKVYSSWEYLDTATKPDSPKTLKLIAASKHQIKAKWSKVKACSGYQVQFAKDKKFKKIIATREVGKKSRAYTGKNFTKGKTYYVRVRAFTKSGDKKVYSAWTKGKSVKAS